MSRAAPKRMPKKQKADTAGLEPLACALEAGDPSIAPLEKVIESEGGLVVGRYKDPLGGHPLVTAILPVGKIEPTPFQRDVSDMHHKKLADVIDRTGMFLDPIIAITAPKDGFWTPNGGHRLAAMRRLGAKSITALVVPKREVAWQILALNTEKAHNLKDKSLEVIRIFRNLLEDSASKPEKDFAYYFEEASLITMGLCYEKHPRFSGGVYNSFVRRLTSFSEESLTKSLKAHERIAEMLLELDAKVGEAVAKLKAKGFISPYLKAFVVGRSNPLRFMKEPPELEELIKTIRGKVERMNVDKIKQEDITASGGGGAADEES